MAWNDTPKAPDVILTTQEPIQSNFAGFNTALAINHYSMDGGALKGMHKKMDLVRQEKTASQITVSSIEIALYDNQVATGDNLFVKKSTGAHSVTATTKQSRELASGVVIKNGSKEVPNVTSSIQTVDVDFESAFTSAPHALLLSALNTKNLNNSISGYIILSYSNVTTTGFKIHYALNSGAAAWSPSPTILKYIAIGV